MKKGKIFPNDSITTRRLKELRTEKGLSQNEIADILKISLKSYRNKELQTMQFTSQELTKMSEYYGVSIDYLLGSTDYRYPSNESISDEIMLTDDSLNMLHSWKTSGSTKNLEVLNTILEYCWKHRTDGTPTMLEYIWQIIHASDVYVQGQGTLPILTGKHESAYPNGMAINSIELSNPEPGNIINLSEGKESEMAYIKSTLDDKFYRASVPEMTKEISGKLLLKEIEKMEEEQ